MMAQVKRSQWMKTFSADVRQKIKDTRQNTSESLIEIIIIIPNPKYAQLQRVESLAESY